MSGEVCCICKRPCIDPGNRLPTFDEAWSWGPDGMHCHFACEGEFVRRYPHLLPKGYQPRQRP